MQPGGSHHPHGARRLGVALLAASLVVLAASCSDDGDAAKATSTTAAAATTTTEVADPYPDFTPSMYAGTKNWLCHPDVERDECTDRPATVVEPDLTISGQPAKPAQDPPIDCFYVYPTTSADPGVSSDLEPDAELQTVAAQAARFSKVCRLYAPMYRQITLSGIGVGGTAQGDRAKADAQADADLLDAWKTYLTEENGGRGVVLMGHSQGMSRLITLMQQEVDGNEALRDRVVSAILMGGAVQVPEGKDVGGTFKHLPACTSADQTGCIISFSSWPASNPPQEGGYFGRDKGDGEVAMCVNPVELAGGNDLADSVVPRDVPVFAQNDRLSSLPGDTPYVALPGTFRAECKAVNGHHVLLFSPSGAAADERRLDGLMAEQLGPTWGLHLFDAQLPQDDLIEIVEMQTRTWQDDGGASSAVAGQG